MRFGTCHLPQIKAHIWFLLVMPFVLSGSYTAYFNSVLTSSPLANCKDPKKKCKIHIAFLKKLQEWAKKNQKSTLKSLLIM
jgi:hypothetical protein